MTKGPKRLSIRERTVRLLEISDCTMTAFEITQILDEKVSTVSGILKKLVDTKELGRISDYGPGGGGFGYFWMPT